MRVCVCNIIIDTTISVQLFLQYMPRRFGSEGYAEEISFRTSFLEFYMEIVGFLEL